MIPRQIWIYWHQGWDSAPLLQQYCLQSWAKRNADWRIFCLSRRNIGDFIDLPAYAELLENVSLTALSDVVRVHLLSVHGGVWVDSTTWSADGLDAWLDRACATSDFFAFDKPSEWRPVASWFIASSRANYMAEAWKNETDAFWKQNTDALRAGGFNESLHLGKKDYFWFHRLFFELLDRDALFADRWRQTLKISADESHFLQKVGLLSAPTEESRRHIREKSANVYKLDSRLGANFSLSGTVLGDLFATL